MDNWHRGNSMTPLAQHPTEIIIDAVVRPQKFEPLSNYPKCNVKSNAHKIRCCRDHRVKNLSADAQTAYLR